MKIYSIYDRVMEAHVMTMVSDNQGTVQREIKTRLANSPFAEHAHDYSVFELAAWDDRTGTITPYDKHSLVCSLADLFSVSDDSNPDLNAA